MQKLSFEQAVRQPASVREIREYPVSGDRRARAGLLFPEFTPKRRIDFRGAQVFTIGSCFARNIEQALAPLGCRVPTLDFAVPPEEFRHAPNGLLNEYNPGSTAQRILLALEGASLPDDSLIPVGDGVIDPQLKAGASVTRERALGRRREIDAVYRRLGASDCAIVTLGFVECWYDEELRLFLNRMPTKEWARKHPGRFSFRRLGVEETTAVLAPALEALGASGVHVILTVSPVPLQVTFSGEDCVNANEYSKAVLRVAAGQLAALPGVDYFPAYEIVRSGGLASYIDDHTHVREEVVREVADHMLSAYEQSA